MSDRVLDWWHYLSGVSLYLHNPCKLQEKASKFLHIQLSPSYAFWTICQLSLLVASFQHTAVHVPSTIVHQLKAHLCMHDHCLNHLCTSCLLVAVSTFSVSKSGSIDAQKIFVFWAILSYMQLSPELNSDYDILNSDFSVNTSLRNIKVLLTMWALLLLLQYVTCSVSNSPFNGLDINIAAAHSEEEFK